MAITKIIADSITSGAVANTPSFNALLSARQTGVAANSNVKINFNQTTINEGSNFDTSTYKFTPTTAGTYFLMACMSIPSGTDWDNNQIQIYKNGSNIARSSNFQTSNSSTKTFALVEANGSSDYFEVYVYWNGSGNQEIDNANGRTYFSGFKLL
jgi:hypothetical protein